MSMKFQSFGKRSLKDIFDSIELPSGVTVVAVLAAVFLLTGCWKKPETSPTVPKNPKTAAPATVVVSPDKTNVANAAPNLAEISDALDWWMTYHQRRPTNFAEFANDPDLKIKIPPPPPGKKYAFYHMRQVILINR